MRFCYCSNYANEDIVSYIISICSVLTDPNKRIVYDMFGEEGLSTSWEVGPRLKTPQEVGIC